MAAVYSDLVAISQALTRAGVVHALGGSGLMRLLGLEVEVEDWDITTDVDESAVAGIAEQYEHARLARVEPFRTRYAYRLRVGGSDVDLMGGFAVDDGEGVVACRTLVTGHHGAVPLGSAAEWAKMYRALGEAEKARKLEGLNSAT